LDVPRPVNRGKLRLYLHECGHAKLHCAADLALPSHLLEYQADQYAVRAMIEAGLAISDAEIYQIMNGHEWELRYVDAPRGKPASPEIVQFLKMPCNQAAVDYLAEVLARCTATEQGGAG
jgi:hypothetical protein